LTPDVNVLVYAHRRDTADHERYRSWLEHVVHSDLAFGVSDTVLAGFVRIVTHPRIFRLPTPLETAIAFAEAIRGRPNAVLISPGEGHWRLFTELCRTASAKGNLVPDAYLAALAIEAGCEWVTTDRDFARFTGLRWRHPFDA